MILPEVVTERTKPRILLGSTSYFLGLYLLTSRFHLGEPRLLPFSWIDSVAPFLGWSIWVYTSAYAGIMFGFWGTRDSLNLNRLFYGFITLVTVSVIVFFMWPTTFPRADFPTPPDLDPLTRLAWDTTRGVDAPTNCFPSLHVSACFLVSFAYLHEQRHKAPLFILWSASVGASTLTTKQHYLADVVSGLFLAILIHWFFRSQVRIEKKRDEK